MATTQVEIVVPDGLGPGDAFDVEWGGVNYNIAVPDGCAGGTALNIDLPSLDQPAATEPPPPIAEEPCTNMKFKPDQKIEMMRSDGSMYPGTIVKGWQGRFGPTYEVLLDEGTTERAVTEDDIIKQVALSLSLTLTLTLVLTLALTLTLALALNLTLTLTLTVTLTL